MDYFPEDLSLVFIKKFDLFSNPSCTKTPVRNIGLARGVIQYNFLKKY